MTETVVLLIGGIYACWGVTLLLGASWYDLLRARLERARRTRPNARQYRARPWVTIILHANGDIAATKRTVGSLQKLTYRKRRIIVIGAKRSVFKNISHNKSYEFAKKMPVVGASRGALTLELPSGVELSPTAITNAVVYLNTHTQADAVQLALQPYFYPSQFHLFAAYHIMTRTLLQKAFNIFGPLKMMSAAPVIVQSKYNYMQAKRRIVYDDTAVCIYPPISDFYMLSKMQHLGNDQTIFHRLRILPLFLAVSYALYTALWQHQPAFLLLVLLCATLFLCMAIWWNSHLSWRQKIVFSLLIPLAYTYLYGRMAFTILEVLADMTKAIFPVGVGLFVRIKYVFRIVE